MKKTIILCDRCGKEIPGTIRVCQDYSSNPYLAVEGDKKYSDICSVCATKVFWLMLYRRPTPAQLYNEAQEKSEKFSTNTVNLLEVLTSYYHEIDGRF